MPKKKKSKNKGVPLDLSKMAEIDGRKRSENTTDNWVGDVDPENSVKIIQDIFKGRVDADVVAMVFSECEFNVDQAVETLFTLVDDTNSEATGMDNKMTYDEICPLNCSSSDDDVNCNRNQSLYDWPTLQTACSFRQCSVKHNQQSAKNNIAIVQSASHQPYTVSSSPLEIPTVNGNQYGKTIDITKSVQDECIQTTPDDSSSELHEEQNELLQKSLDKTITNICKSYALSTQQPPIEYEGISNTLDEDLPKFSFDNCFLNKNNQHTFIVPKLTPSTETVSNMPFITLPNAEILKQTPSFVKCLNQCNVTSKETALSNVITSGLLHCQSLYEEANQLGTNNSKMSARETVSTYMRIGKKLLVILRGLPGSGKSTLAWQLYSEFSGSVFSTDDFFMRDGKYNMDYSALSEAHEWNRKRAEMAMGSGDFLVIIDNTNVEAWEIKPYVALGLKYGYFIEILEPETSWKFNLNQLSKRNTHGVPKTKIIRMLERYDHNVSLGDIIDEINSKFSDSSTTVANLRNFSSADGLPKLEISETYSDQQKSEHQAVDNFNVKLYRDSVDYAMQASFSEESQLGILSNPHSKEANRNDNCVDRVENGATASAIFGTGDIGKNNRIGTEGEKSLCLDELIGLLYESEESLSRHTSLSCSSQDVSAWEAITELDDDFLWTAEILPTASKSGPSKSELNEVDETNAKIENDKFIVDNIAEISSLQHNAVTLETSSNKTLNEEKDICEVFVKTQNRTDEEIISEIYLKSVATADEKNVDAICAEVLKSNTDKKTFSEKICPELCWKESACSVNLTDDDVSSLDCTQQLKEFKLNDSCEKPNKENDSLKVIRNSISNFDDIAEDENTFITLQKQTTSLSNTIESKLELKEDVITWEDCTLGNSDWDSDKSVDKTLVCETEPKPQRKCKRQKKEKFQIDYIRKNEECLGSKSISQENTINFLNSSGSRNLQVARNEGISEQSKTYWTRSNKKSKVAARLTCGLENNQEVKVDQQESTAYSMNGKLTKEQNTFHEHICLRCNIIKEDHATQVDLKDFILLQNNYNRVYDDKHFKMKNTTHEEPLNIVYDETYDTNFSHCENIVHNHTQKDKSTPLDSLQHFFPFVPKEELQNVLEYSHYNLGEAVFILIKFGYTIVNETKELFSSAIENVLNLSHKKTEKKVDVVSVADSLISHNVSSAAETSKNIEVSSNKNYANTTHNLDDKVSTLPNALKMELKLDPTLAFQLQKLFGSVNFHSSADSFSLSDRTVVLDMEVAKMLHHCWIASQKNENEEINNL